MKSKEEVLQNCTVEGNVVKLPGVQLDRKLYQDVAKSLELIGGKWKGGKVFGFVFQKDPSDLLSEIANGEKRNLKKEFQFFATPKFIASLMVVYANLKDNDVVLEPSAGQGAIIEKINALDIVPDCYELMDVNVSVLKSSGLNFNLLGNDFLCHSGKKYTKIIANPPFTKNQDIDHLLKMYEILAIGGRLVCITSQSWERGSQKKQVEFREWLSKVGARVENLPAGTFKESGTMVGANLIVIDKP